MNRQVRHEEDSLIGSSVPRLDGAEKVTGEAVFADDFQFGPNLLHGRIVRSPHPHALILNIDARRAMDLPGVRAVVTGADSEEHIGLYLKDRFIFCRDRARFVGDPVAGVIAVDEETAARACALIAVEYEVLDPVLDPIQGSQPDAPLLHPDLGSYVRAAFIDPQPGSNIANYFRVRKGDVEAAWDQCEVVVEHSFRVPHVQHVPIEPHIAVARVADSGEITLWSSSQSPFAQRNLIAEALAMSQSDIRVIAPYVGGGFGSKAGVSVEGMAVVMARAVPGFPVKLRLTREEEFTCSFVRQGLVARTKVGADKDGRLLAMKTEYYWDAGAYAEYGVNITRASGYSSTGPYRIPNVWADSYCVYTNHPVGGPMRGFGMPEIHWGIEQIMDLAAEELGMDKVAFRLRNCLKGGDRNVTGMEMHPIGLSECIQKAADAVEWGKPVSPTAPGRKRGKGLAIMWKAPAMPPNAGSSAWVRLNEDATVSLGIGGQEIGQGCFTAAAQMAAEALGVPMDWIRVSRPVDTRYSPYEWQTVASRLTWSMGNAVVDAAENARKQILDLAAEHWDEEPSNLDIRGGEVISYRSERSMPLKDMVVYGLPLPDGEGWHGGPIIGHGSFMPTYVTDLDNETGQGKRAVVHYTTGCQAVDLEVDTNTGRVIIHRLASAFDVGKAINPEQVRAQMEGGVVQGISTALLESLQFENGQPVNAGFVDYRIATSVDIPGEIIPIIVEVPQDDGPWGARGIGEQPMVPTAPAIANAVAAATGIRILELPLTPERVYLALEAKRIQGSAAG